MNREHDEIVRDLMFEKCFVRNQNTVISQRYEYFQSTCICRYFQPVAYVIFSNTQSTQYASRVLSCAQIPHYLSSRLQLPLRKTLHAPRRLDTPLPPLLRVNAPFARVSTTWRQRGAACPPRGPGQNTQSTKSALEIYIYTSPVYICSVVQQLIINI